MCSKAVNGRQKAGTTTRNGKNELKSKDDEQKKECTAAAATAKKITFIQTQK